MSQKTATQFNTIYNSSGSGSFPDNNAQAIVESIMRQFAEDIKDSFFNLLDGAFGIPTAIVYTADLNDITQAGFYYADTAASNKADAQNGYVISSVRSTSYQMQMYFTYSTNMVYVRTKNAGTWSAWINIAGGDVLATVLTGLSTASTADVTAADTILQAIGKLQANKQRTFFTDGSQAMAGDIDVNNYKVKQVADATSNDEAVNLGQLNAAIDGLKPKDDARAATTANITLNDEQTVDGVALVDGDRVLVKDQTDASENGIYLVVDNGDWTRTTDADTSLELQGAFVQISEGTLNEGTAWVQYSTDFTLGTDDVLWRQIGATVPDATDSTKGKAKLYTSLGSNTDGAPNQNVVTRAIQDSSAISGTASGTDTYTVTLSPTLTAYATRQIFEILFTNANTGAATINIDGLGAKAIKKNVSSALVANDIQAGQILNIAYDGTNFQIIGGSVAQATDSLAGVAKLYTTTGSNTDGSMTQNAITNALAAKEDTANKDTDSTFAANSDTKYPSQKAVKTAVDAKEALANKDTDSTFAANSDTKYPSQKAVKTAVDLKAPLASPTFTGTPAAPTASLGTNSTQLATTAYVQTELANAATIANVGAKLYLFNNY